MTTLDRTAALHLPTQGPGLAILAVLAILSALLSTVIVMILQLAAVVLLLIVVVALMIALRPRLGLYFAFGLALLFEALGADPLMLPGRYLHGGLGATVGLSGVALSPFEVLLTFTFLAWLLNGIATRHLDFRAGELGLPMLLFVVALAIGLLHGLLGGGDPYFAFWELRYLIYVPLAYVLACNTIRTLGQVRALTIIALLAMGLFAVEGAYRRVALIDTGQLGVVRDFRYDHEDAIFLAALVLLVLAFWTFGAPRWQLVLGLVLVPVGAFTLLATERRAGMIALVAAFFGVSLALLVIDRKLLFRLVIPLAVAAALYLPLFWNDTGVLGQPARAIRSLYDPNVRDAASNLYRYFETINVRATIYANAFLGVGFGQQFWFYVPLPDLSWWPFWRFEPHNNILWIWLKTGAVGFVMFWLLMGAALARASHLAKTLRLPEARMFALFTLAGLVVVLVFSYLDLGLVSGRVTLFVGATMGVLAVLERIGEEGASNQWRAVTGR